MEALEGILGNKILRIWWWLLYPVERSKKKDLGLWFA